MVMGAVVLHVAPGASNIEPALRGALAEVDPDLSVVRVLRLSSQVGMNFRLNRMLARLTAAYALLALAVGALGIYGVTAYAVAERTREIGMRMALGADRSRVLQEVVGGALAETGVGLLFGFPSALLATSALGTLLYGLGPRDPFVLGASALVLVLTAALAAAVPARRAASIDPSRALRAH